MSFLVFLNNLADSRSMSFTQTILYQNINSKKELKFDICIPCQMLVLLAISIHLIDLESAKEPLESPKSEKTSNLTFAVASCFSRNVHVKIHFNTQWPC